MVVNLLDTVEIDSDLEDLILEKTEGVPFFIEEFLRSLNDLRIIDREDKKYHLAKDIRDASAAPPPVTWMPEVCTMISFSALL